MQLYQRRFIELALSQQALSFGEFTLKSGRISPYFYNAGLFNTGAALAKLSQAYAEAIVQSGIAFDMLFGPAYKGIPLATSTAMDLALSHNLDIPYAFNRKEAKDHGEGGNLVGAPLQGRVLLIDDVITAGTAVRESMPLLQAAGAELAGIIITLDRQERGQGNQSAIQEIQQQHQTPVISIINLDNIVNYLQETGEFIDYLPQLKQYRQKYGVS